jgi:hypothetical protein
VVAYPHNYPQLTTSASSYPTPLHTSKSGESSYK